MSARSARALAKAAEAAGMTVQHDDWGDRQRVIAFRPMGRMRSADLFLQPDPKNATIPVGRALGLQALWDSGKVEAFIYRRGWPVRLVGYRELLAELRTGRPAETAEDRVRTLLGGLYLNTEKA